VAPQFSHGGHSVLASRLFPDFTVAKGEAITAEDMQAIIATGPTPGKQRRRQSDW